MSSYIELLRFEIRYRLWRWSSIIYALVFAFAAYMISLSFAGAFKGVSISLGFSNKLALNSPLTLHFLISILGYIGLLVSAPIFGQSINKDFENQFNQILFTTPLTKRTYFSIRYLGSLISSTVILLSIAVGIWIATKMPFVDRSLIAENHLWFYISPYLTNLIPNLMIFGGVFIAVASLAKKMAPVYVASIAVFTGWMIAENLTSDLENKRLAALLDPFGLDAASLLTRYWSIAEQSAHVVPISGILLTNRLIWLGFGLILTFFAYWVFNPYEVRFERKKPAPPETLKAEKPIPISAGNLNPHSLKVIAALARDEFKQAFKNIYFLMILLCGCLYLIAVGSQTGKMFGTETWPVTYDVLDVLGGTFSLFITILITYYSGELIWRDRDLNVYELVDSKPVPNHFLYLSKLGALFSLQIFLSLVVLICCVLTQTFKGYYNYEWGVYFQHLVIYGLPPKLLLCIFALFVHTLVPNKYAGHSIIVLYFISMIWIPFLGFDHVLYLMGQLPRAIYSDMNGFGTSGYKFSILFIYWAFLSGAFAILTLLFWRRGAILTFKDRWQELRDRWRPAYKFSLSFSFSGFVLMGGFVYYNTNILNVYKSKSTLEKEKIDYETKYSAFKKMPRLEILDVNLHADIYPETQSLHERGVYLIRNRTQQNIERILVQASALAVFKELKFDRPNRVEENDERLRTWTYHFDPPIKPGEELHLNFDLAVEPHGFLNGDFGKIIVGNGTFIHNEDYNPVLNYQREREIPEEKTRRKYGLADRPRLFDVNDREVLDQTEFSNEGTWIHFQATVSTSPDQIAVTPGYLTKEWSENGRHFFHYEMDSPIWNFYSILSARYTVERDEWNGVKIEVYHHPGHTYDTARMIASVKKSLALYSKIYSPYQFRQLRIFEFPRYSGFAQSFPNTVPYSESVGFIARVRENDPESLDYPFYVTSHEVAHQWWGHQVAGAPVQGASMLVESLAQYSAFLVQEKEYGPQQMKKFFKYELDRYLFGRSREEKRELPLALNEEQPYIHYEKGGLVFYALKDYFGEEWVNGILKGFIKDHAFKEGPFPRALDLVERFRKAAPDDKKYIIDDLFTTITLYNNRAESASAVKQGDKWQVTLEAFTQKLRANDLGGEVETPMHDYIDVGIYDKDGHLLYLQKHKLESGHNTIQILVDARPFKAGVDPLNKLIDRIPDDNTVNISESVDSLKR